MQSNVLYKTRPSAQKAGKTKSQAMEEFVIDNMFGMLVRFACLEFDLFIQDTNVGGGQGHHTRDGGARHMTDRGMGGLFGAGGDLLDDDNSDTGVVLTFELAWPPRKCFQDYGRGKHTNK